MNPPVPPPPSGQIWLEAFVSKHYGKQPRWVRVPVFLIFAILLALAIHRATLGDHTIHGRILQRSVTGFTPARMYEVEFGDRTFGTNSKGFYYMVLSPLQYYSVMASGGVELEVSHGNTIFPSQEVKFGRIKQRLADIRLEPAPATEDLTAAPPAADERRSPLDLVVSRLWAQSTGPTDRLFVKSIRLSPATRLRQATLEVQGQGDSRKLMWARTGNLAGQVPVLPGELISFDAGYWLPWLGPSGGDSVRITLEGGGGIKNAFLGRHSEHFSVGSLPAPGREFTVMGDDGTQLTLVRMLPYNLILFDKDDLAGIRDGLRQDLTASGYFVALGASPLGTRGQTNALFGGAGVPFTALQTVIKAAVERGVTFKTIEYRKNLISGNPHEIQLGGSAAFNTRPAIPSAVIQELLAATTEDQFRAVLDRLKGGGT